MSNQQNDEEWIEIDKSNKRKVNNRKSRNNRSNYGRNNNNSYRGTNRYKRSNIQCKKNEKNVIKDYVKRILASDSKITFEQCKENAKTMQDKLELRYRFSCYLSQQTHLDIYKKMLTEWPSKIQNNGLSDYSPIHGAIWNSNASIDIIIDIINLLGEFEYDIFQKNGKGENAFKSLQIRYEKDKSVDKTKIYLAICKLSDKQITRMMNQILNKISSEIDDKSIDKIRLCLINNPKVTMQTFVNSIIKRKISIKYVERDNSIIPYVDAIIQAISGADFGYQQTIIKLNDLKYFFEKKGDSILKEAELYKMLFDIIKTTGCYAENINNRYNDWEATSILFGEFYRRQVLIEECNKFMECCAGKNELFDFYTVAKKSDRVRMFIRAVSQFSTDSFRNTDKAILADMFVNWNLDTKEKYGIMNCIDKILSIKIKSIQIEKWEEESSVNDSNDKIIEVNTSKNSDSNTSNTIVKIPLFFNEKCDHKSLIKKNLKKLDKVKGKINKNDLLFEVFFSLFERQLDTEITSDFVLQLINSSLFTKEEIKIMCQQILDDHVQYDFPKAKSRVEGVINMI